MWGKPLDENARLWRDALFEAIQATDSVGLPVLLSGGMDSVTLVAALLALGGRPDCYSYRLGGNDSDDYRMSEIVATDHGLRFVGVTVPRDLDVTVDDIRRVAKLLPDHSWIKKAAIQCSIPVVYIVEAIKVDGRSRAIVGTGAICLDDRRVHQLWHTEGEESAREYREAKLDDRYTNCGTGAMHAVARVLGVGLEEPYSDEPLRSVALAMDYADLNQPRQKGIALRAFPKFFSRGYWRRNSSLQVNSGFRQFHDVALIASEYNTIGALRPDKLYRHFVR